MHTTMSTAMKRALVLVDNNPGWHCATVHQGTLNALCARRFLRRVARAYSAQYYTTERGAELAAICRRLPELHCVSCNNLTLTIVGARFPLPGIRQYKLICGACHARGARFDKAGNCYLPQSIAPNHYPFIIEGV